MPLNYPELRKKFTIPDTHTLSKISTQERDRATYSEEKSEIKELDESGQLIAVYLETDYADAYGNKVDYQKIS